MNGKLILGLINYFTLSLIFIFGLIAVLLKNQKKKLTFLFLMFLCCGIISYLFFAGVAFIIPGILVLFFYVFLFLFVSNQEFFGLGKQKVSGEAERIEKNNFNISIIINLLLAIFFCAGIGYLLFIYTGSYYQSFEFTGDLSTVTITDIINNVGSNYIPVIFLITGGLTVSIVWFIGIIKSKEQ
jgi:hypothetical protein